MPKWTLSRGASFCAAHHLPKHDGRCARPHGHNYRVRLFVIGETLQVDGPKSGMIIDYQQIDEVLSAVIDPLDHRDLNEILEGDTTAERVAAWIFDGCVEAIEGRGFPGRIEAVEVEEVPGTVARYET